MFAVRDKKVEYYELRKIKEEDEERKEEGRKDVSVTEEKPRGRRF